MPSTYLRYTISALLMVCLCPYLYAQSATLEGSVSDASGELMPGITVILDNDQGVATDVSGNFILRNISPGKHTLAISGVGYAAKTQAVSLKEGQTLRLSIQLEEGLLEMDEVIVQGKSEAQVKMEQPIKVEAMDISRIQERSTPVPQLINQMPGVNIRQSAGVGSTVTVNLNGLQGNAIRYFRDGIPLDYLGKAFDISIVPIGQLGGVEVYKGILPASLGADALGGAINLISNNLYESQLDVSYGFGSFNTHQANVNGFFQIPGTKLYTKLSSYYVSAENNYEMEVQVVDEESQTLKPANVTRFHDGVESKFVEVAAGVTDIRYADLFEIGYAYFDYEKEEQHGFNVSKPFGEVMNYENFDAFHTRYKKALGKLEIDLFGAYSMKNTLFADTSGNRYDWNGDVVAVVSGTEGEANTKSFRSLDFENFVGRFNLTYQLGKAAITLNHNITTDRRVGNDPFGQRIGIDGETIDPFSIPASYDKNISGLQVTFPLWKERITQVVTAKRYAITTSSLSQWGIGDLTPTFSDESYGVGTSLKFSFSPDRFIRLSYENATRIPESREYFGDGAFLIGNPFLNPEQSHNINL
ncbi:MAG: carboxypeptidase-like regulatory domain-containing protein, partial [Bacteroidota bacterium]